MSAMNTVWNTLPKPILILAPMEAVTDVVFRHVIAQAAPPDLFFTEFTNATGWVHAGDKAIGGRLIRTDDEKALIAQLWGSDPSAMEQLARHCKELGYQGIDLNMGCPDSSAIKGGGGAQMIRTPEIAAEMIAAAKRSGLPVSVKTRLGYSFIDEWRDWLTHLLRQDIVALTIHLRTKKEMSKVEAHWELMDDIKALRDQIAPDTLLIGNGDVVDRTHAEELTARHGIDGVMIGRGIFHNPYAFEKEPARHDRSELLGLLRTQLHYYDEYHHLTHRPFDTLKRFFKIYVRDFDGASQLRDRLMHTKTTQEVRQVLDELDGQ
jgi:tRNA-dihydrouridine synthase